MKDLSTLTERAKAVEESVECWNLKMNQAIDEHEAAVESGDNEAQYSTAEKLKSLLRRAELEKIEMAKIESEINQAVAEAAFAGNYSSGLKRKKNG